MYHLDRTRLYGREIEVEFARGNRKSMLLAILSVYRLHVAKSFIYCLTISMLCFVVSFKPLFSGE